jgi:hypothetical protein
MMAGRKRKLDAIRDESGKSRDHERLQQVDYEARLMRRKLDLIGEGISPDHAHLGLSGFTLGKMYLLHKANPADPGGITRAQYNIGERIARILRCHASVILGSKRATSSPGSGQMTDEDIGQIRDEFRIIYDAMAEYAGTSLEARKAAYLVYGICVENWPASQLNKYDFGTLREALNHVGRALEGLDRRRKL